MKKMYIKKLSIYILGYVFLAFGVALHYKHGLGAAPLDALTNNLAKALKIDVGLVVFGLNFSFALLFFIAFRNKDIYLTVIGIFVLSLLISLFDKLLTFEVTNIWFKILIFVIAINVLDFGIALVYVTDMSRSAWECLVLFTNKFCFKKYELRFSRAILETLTALLGLIVGLVFLKGTGDISYATIPLMLFTGYIVDFYYRLLKKIIKFPDKTVLN